MNKRDWRFWATVTRVIDGDTVEVTADLGLDIYRDRLHVRLLDINAPEMKTPEGPASKEALSQLLPVGSNVMVVSKKWDKYGNRIDAFIFTRGEDGQPAVNASTWMLVSGFAAPYKV